MVRRVYAFGGSTFFALLLVGAGVVLAPNPVSALPSFARQTGQPCATCHSAFPQLTPYGRRFKLEGYTAGGTRCGDVAAADVPSLLLQIPIAGMTVPSFTHVNKPLDKADTPKGFKTNDNTFVQESSLFYGGQVYCNLGAFVQGTYERPGSSYFLDNTDIRYAGKTKLGGTDLVFGVTANNNPTVQDPWNTTPAWSFPFVGASDALAPTPSAGTMIEGTFSGRVAGTGVYIFANNSFYLEGAAYGTFDTQTLEALGLDPSGSPEPLRWSRSLLARGLRGGLGELLPHVRHVRHVCQCRAARQPVRANRSDHRCGRRLPVPIHRRRQRRDRAAHLHF